MNPSSLFFGGKWNSILVGLDGEVEVIKCMSSTSHKFDSTNIYISFINSKGSGVN